MVTRRSIVVEMINDQYVQKLREEGYGRSYSDVVDRIIEERRLNEQVYCNPN